MEPAAMILAEAFLFAAATIGVICIRALVGLIVVAVMDRGRDL
jgi:hypothetical protein